ncbi:Fic family protein [Vibrio sp. 1-Bac 57]
MSKYELDDKILGYQPNSNEKVLLNKHCITDEEEINNIETFLLLKLYEKEFASIVPSHLTFMNILNWHRQWLGNVYEWAGKLRYYRMWKGDFEFTLPLQIEADIAVFETKYLSNLHKIKHFDYDDLVRFLSESHVDFILLHPFREGNGRISRLLMDYMCDVAGIGLLDYSLWDENKDFYVKSIQAGYAGNYQHMERLVRGILKG